MALSASTNFSVDRDTLIKGSLRLIGAIDPDETPTATEITNASESLNMMLKAWQSDGLQLWVRKQKVMSLTASQGSYTLGPSGADVTMDRPYRILGVYRRDSSNNDIPLTQMMRDEYYQLSNKSTTGTPSSWYYNQSLTSGTLYLWNIPNAAAASLYTLVLDYHKPFDDMDSSTNDFEFPQEWYEAIKYGLAHRLAPEYGVDINERKMLYVEFQGIYKAVKDSDVEEVIRFSPRYQ